MPSSEARILANRANARKSTGPRTPEGKAISRRNSLKHGMTGEGIVLPIEDQAEVDRRFEALDTELAPSSELSAILVKRVATMSVRMERCVKEEAARLSEKVRNAAAEFDDRRLSEVERLFDWIASTPSTNSRRLLGSPEGVDRLIRGYRELLEDLESGDPARWGYGQFQRLENMKGRRPEDFPQSREGLFCKLIWCEPVTLEPGDPEGLDKLGRRDWARAGLIERIAAEIVALQTLRSGFDHEALAKDRAEAPARATLDSSKAGILARKYEASAERSFYRALKEFRQVEAEMEEVEDAESDEEIETSRAAVGSSFPEDSDDATTSPHPVDSRPYQRSRRGGRGPSRPS